MLKTNPNRNLSSFPNYYRPLKKFGAGRKPLTLGEIAKMGGGYNMWLQTSLPEELRLYDIAHETEEAGLKAFATTFPRGFVIEILQVYSGPPVIAYRFRHWAFMEGPFKGHPPTGEMVELYVICIFELNEESKIDKAELFYDRGEPLGALMKGVASGESASGMSSSCPFLNTYRRVGQS